MKINKSSTLFWVLTSLPFILTMLYFNLLPDQIPAHYGASGQVDRWGSKWGVFIIPLVSIFVGLIFKLWIGKLMDIEKYRANASALDRILMIVPLVFLVLTILNAMTALRSKEELN